MEFIELGKVCEIKNGFAFKSTDFKEVGAPLLRISNFDNGKVFLNENTIYVDEKYLQEKSNFIVEKGDILIALSGATTGKFGIYKEDFPSLLNQRIGLLKSGKSENLNSKYFYFYLSILKKEILRKAGGAAQPNISTKTISEFKIPLPPLPEQQRIAHLLDEADKLRQLNQQLIQKYEQLTQSLFLEMFGDPVTNPKEWEMKTLNEVIIDIQNGIGKGKKYYGRGNKVANIGDLYPSYSFTPTKFSLLEVNKKEIEKYKLKYGDLLFVRSSLKKEGVAFCSFFNSNEICLFSSFMIKITPNLELLNPYFLSIQMRTKSYRKYIINASNTATITNISQPNLKALKIIVPDKSLQTQFAERVGLIEAQKQQAQEALQKSEDLFNSLLQEVFKG